MPRISVGAKGPKMTRIAARIGEEILLGASMRIDELEQQLGDLAESARSVGRDLAKIDIASIIVTSVSATAPSIANTIAVVAQMSRLDDAEIGSVGVDPERVATIRRQLALGATLPILFTFGCSSNALLDLGAPLMRRDA